MAESFLKAIDEAMRTLIFTTFGEDMEFSSLESDDVILYPKEIAQRFIAERREENVVEFANLWRESTRVSWKRQRTPVARQGIYGSYVDGEAPSSDVSGEKIALDTIKAVPADLNYNVWFWSQDKDKINKVAETYLFWKQNDPNLDLYYKATYPLEFDLHFTEGEIVDESDLPHIFEIGRIFVARIPITVDGWVFKDSQTKTIKKIIVTIYDEDDIEDVNDFLEEATAQEKANLQLYQKTIYAEET
jgi:hypothetical protein